MVSSFRFIEFYIIFSSLVSFSDFALLNRHLLLECIISNLLFTEIFRNFHTHNAISTNFIAFSKILFNDYLKSFDISGIPNGSLSYF